MLRDSQSQTSAGFANRQTNQHWWKQLLLFSYYPSPHIAKLCHQCRPISVFTSWCYYFAAHNISGSWFIIGSPLPTLNMNLCDFGQATQFLHYVGCARSEWILESLSSCWKLKSIKNIIKALLSYSFKYYIINRVVSIQFHYLSFYGTLLSGFWLGIN